MLTEAVALSFRQRFPQWANATQEHDSIFEAVLESPMGDHRLLLTTEDGEISI